MLAGAALQVALRGGDRVEPGADRRATGPRCPAARQPGRECGGPGPRIVRAGHRFKMLKQRHQLCEQRLELIRRRGGPGLAALR